MEKINLVELLKDCPKGTKLYSPLCGECEFDHIEYMGKIVCQTKKDTTIWFLPTGVYIEGYSGAECVLFPSKENRDWSKFQRPFKDGDILISGLEDCGNNPFIFKQTNCLGNAQCYCAINVFEEFILNSDNWTPIKGCRLATEEEKQKLFQAIKDNGYKWNAETKTLDKRYHSWTINDAKDGDVLAINWYEGDDYWEKIVIFKKYHNNVDVVGTCVEGYGNTFKNRKLVWDAEVPYFSKTWTGTLQPATKEQSDFLFQKIKEAGYEWNPETKTLEKLPKFKIGDKIRHKNDNTIRTINYIYHDSYGLYDCHRILFEEQDDYELVPDIKPKFKVGDRIKKNKNSISGIITNISDDGMYKVEYQGGGISYVSLAYQDEWELVPNKFDITTLKPFESKVLVRDNDSNSWCPAIFGCKISTNTIYKYATMTEKYYAQCIPYENNEHLSGTTYACDEYFKTW